eukprot:6857133-Karenia_brevis.AAC.1
MKGKGPKIHNKYHDLADDEALECTEIQSKDKIAAIPPPTQEAPRAKRKKKDANVQICLKDHCD